MHGIASSKGRGVALSYGLLTQRRCTRAVDFGGQCVDEDIKKWKMNCRMPSLPISIHQDPILSSRVNMVERL